MKGFCPCVNLLPLCQIGFWEVYDGTPIRELEASQSGAINGMDISDDGEHFITGKRDKTHVSHVTVLVISSTVITSLLIISLRVITL